MNKKKWGNTNDIFEFCILTSYIIQHEEAFDDKSRDIDGDVSISYRNVRSSFFFIFPFIVFMLSSLVDTMGTIYYSILSYTPSFFPPHQRLLLFV
jgi:hypothetical protein